MILTRTWWTMALVISLCPGCDDGISQDQDGGQDAADGAADGDDGADAGDQDADGPILHFCMDWATCTGGFTADECAPAPAEDCDGVDDDCDGVIDDVEGLGEACVVSNEFGSCAGVRLCAPGGPDLACSAATPAAEACNYLDDDCDAEVDEDFRDLASGAYLGDLHCGACGVDCASAVEHATAIACALEGEVPRCLATACEPGYYPAGGRLCLPLGEVLCRPCLEDSDCGPSATDRCLALAEGGFCGRDCSAANPYGAAEGECPEGYECVADGSYDPAQCRATTGSCTCLEGAPSASRACAVSNALGTCYGTEACNPDPGSPGWQPCSAPTPAVESCNAADDDCDGLVDDVEHLGEPCSETNAFGTCPGLLACGAAGPDPVCTASIPAAESCNLRDDDCDGLVDDVENRGDPCEQTNAFGTCPGVLDCGAAGPDLVCTAAVPGAETCNHVDDDCSGVVDDVQGLGDACTSTTPFGSCPGLLVCLAGPGLECDAPLATGELCDGRDQDCDGAIDEGFTWPDPLAGELELGQACAVGVGVCARAGVVVCADQGSARCSADPADPLVSGEIGLCNYLDDDCDGETDEDYRDPANGLYSVSAEHCGACGVSCDASWPGGPAAYHLTTSCGVVGGVPSCDYTCTGGYLDLDGAAANGCEFLPDAAAIYVATPADGGQDDPACGSWAAPCATITYGISRAAPGGWLRVAAGVYAEQVTLVPGVSVLGGHSPTSWERDPDLFLSEIAPWASAVDNAAVVATSIHAATEVSGFVIRGPAGGPAVGRAGGNSTAVRVVDSDGSLFIRDNVIFGGQGGAAADGGAGLTGTAGGDGGDGSPSVIHPGCPPGHFACPGNDRCIPGYWLCDGYDDCGDDSDEGSTHCRISANEFHCANAYARIQAGQSPGVDRALVCNGTDNCGDGSDEASCSGARYLCADGNTILTIQLCNAMTDCPDGSDEGEICLKEFRCSTTSPTYLSQDFLCDGTANCLGSTDELNGCYAWDFQPPLPGFEGPSLCGQRGGLGGIGAAPRVPLQGSAGMNGQNAIPPDWGVGGAGGFHVEGSGGSCTFHGWPGSGPGLAGESGTDGDGGAGAADGLGALSSGEWRGRSGVMGSTGVAGHGGGGGGAAGGVQVWTAGAGPVYAAPGEGWFGATGGGGGAGGCHGEGGFPGWAGGGSFGVIMLWTGAGPASTTDMPVIEGNRFVRGPGGPGGNGGFGGTGGDGGLGGHGGADDLTGPYADCIVPGGMGGSGGRGGHGGGGGGGAGGVSYDLAGFNTNGHDRGYLGLNSFALGDSIETGGAGGAGGLSAAVATGDGLDGPAGDSNRVRLDP